MNIVLSAISNLNESNWRVRATSVIPTSPILRMQEYICG